MGLRPQDTTKMGLIPLNKIGMGLRLKTRQRQNMNGPKAQDNTRMGLMPLDKARMGLKPKTQQRIGLRPKTTQVWA